MCTSSDSQGNATYLRLAIENEPTLAILDTGSEVTLIPAALVKGVTLKPVSRRVYAANGTDIDVLGEVEILSMAGRLPLSITGLVSDQINETILGEDFLTSHAAVWDFRNQIVTLDGVGFPLCTRGPHEQCRNAGNRSRCLAVLPALVRLWAVWMQRNDTMGVIVTMLWVWVAVPPPPA